MYVLDCCVQIVIQSTHVCVQIKRVKDADEVPMVCEYQGFTWVHNSVYFSEDLIGTLCMY